MEDFFGNRILVNERDGKIKLNFKLRTKSRLHIKFQKFQHLIMQTIRKKNLANLINKYMEN